MTRLVDVSHVIESGMVTYKGLPARPVCDFVSRERSRSHYAPGVDFRTDRIEMVAKTGTHLAAPFHRYADGARVARLAEATASFSRTRECFVQVTGSAEEKASKKVCRP